MEDIEELKKEEMEKKRALEKLKKRSMEADLNNKNGKKHKPASKT